MNDQGFAGRSERLNAFSIVSGDIFIRQQAPLSLVALSEQMWRL